MKSIRFMPLGDQAIIVSFGNGLSKQVNQRVQSFRHLLLRQKWPFIVDVVATFTNVTVFYNATKQSYPEVRNELKRLLEVENRFNTKKSVQNIYLPVLYDGMDLERVSEKTGLSKKEIIHHHTNQAYPIYMVGFLPGFPYIGGFTEKLSIPRLDKPRNQVPKGSVGIINSQSGIYPVSSPGGWNIIGTTPVELIRLDKKYPFYYQAGDYITFYPVDEDEYKSIRQNKLFEPKIEVIQDGD
ncbi:5-oxoprolinase subunit PxpB [Allobacillus sp. GCM10007491]|uniref:5-oxoprolinase subunit PxpB n=1 Tax=Allobacillus saliphilus TaxID=2912308 RepID=A0A941CV60_9BACI|nr:5-oxoprolinase subunit PxpB [Allobacillus saliphilus]MBR7554578.1 5-oxoprolinase subunit PxpB [Allobacillus saliphilus]